MDKAHSPPKPTRPIVIETLQSAMSGHPIWSAQLLRSISAGWLSAQDTSFLVPLLRAVEAAQDAGLAMLGVSSAARAPSAVLAAWAAGAGTSAEIQGSLSVPTFVRYFTLQYEAACRDREVAEIAACLLGGELVLARLHAAMAKSLATTSAPAICSDGESRAAVLASFLSAGAVLPEHHAAVERVLSLFLQLLEDLYQAVRFQRMAVAFDRIQSRESLAQPAEPAIALYPGVGEIDLEVRDDDRGIEFTVERYPGIYEALDPRVVRISPGKTNNLHKHAHETLFYIVTGVGRILIETTWVSVKAGDAVHAPRWVMHQTANTGDDELVMLAITDYFCTVQVYVGRYDKV